LSTSTLYFYFFLNIFGTEAIIFVMIRKKK
jgi:hypothetical protein